MPKYMIRFSAQLHRKDSDESGGFTTEAGPSNNNVPTLGGQDQQPADDPPNITPLPQYNPLPQIGVTPPSLQQLPQSIDTWVPPPNPGKSGCLHIKAE